MDFGAILSAGFTWAFWIVILMIFAGVIGVGYFVFIFFSSVSDRLNGG